MVLGCTHCLYMGPLIMESEENQAPEIKSWTDGSPACLGYGITPDGEDEMLCLAKEPVNVYVSAVDPDNDALDFFWVGSASGPIGDSYNTFMGDFQVSEVVILAGEMMDGEQVVCTVSDGPNDIDRDWTILVL